jgi:aromatic ring-opening dioxygenase catalytic subunit (LigB family)
MSMPVLFLPHGGGPWPFVDVGIGARAEQDALRAFLESIGARTPKPQALLVVSAHWEAPRPTLMTAANPPMLYDYYGFPPASYRITWPAPGAPALATRVRALLAAGGFVDVDEDAARGYDHGTFVPLKLAYPAADVPVLQLSLVEGLDPETHLALGRALKPLRADGVLVVGSGMTYHNLRAFGPQAAPASEAFDAWLRNACAMDAKARDAALAKWEDAPAARLAHPREEHLLPLHVVAGAAGDDVGRVAYRGTLNGLSLSAYEFG